MQFTRLNIKLLDRPIHRDDPLEVAKHLWQSGVGGELWRATGGASDENGYYFRVFDWAPLAFAPTSNFAPQRDPDCLELLQTTAAGGLPYLVSNRLHPAGFLAMPSTAFHRALVLAVPELVGREVISIGGGTDVYMLVHELHHLDDYRRGLLVAAWRAARELARGHGLSEAQAFNIYTYVIEARAELAKFVYLRAGTRPFESWDSERSGRNWRPLMRPGPELRAWLEVVSGEGFNASLAAPLVTLGGEARSAVLAYFEHFLPGYAVDFDPRDFTMRIPPGLR